MQQKIIVIILACFFYSVSIVTAQKNDTVTTASGLKYFFIKKGKGRLLKPGEVAVWHYGLTLPNGTKIQDTRDNNIPMGMKIPSDDLIKGTNEALLLMHVGDRAVFIFPPSLAYGQRGFDGRCTLPDIMPNTTLVFDMEMTDIKKAALLDTLENTLYTQPITDTSTPRVNEVIALYKDLKKKKLMADMFTSDNDLNTIGYLLLPKYPSDAIKIFLLNVDEYPKVSNVYDSLGEGYMNIKDFTNAILNYEKSLELDPKNKNAVEKIKEMKAKRAKSTRDM